MTLSELLDRLHTVKSPKDFFSLNGDDAEHTKNHFLRLCHPDRNIGNKAAVDAWKAVNDLWDLFKLPPAAPIASPVRAYYPESIIATGDVADVHLAAAADKRQYLLKISRVPEGIALLKNEWENLQTLHAAATDLSYKLYLPEPVESFSVRDTIQKHLNVFAFEPGYYPLTDVHARFPALDGRHLVWIFRRFLTILGFSHKVGVLHGAILPPHVLLCPTRPERLHGLMLVGWGQSVTECTIKIISAEYRKWYPPEVLTKQPVTTATDIFMAARCMVYLAGGDPLANTLPKTVPGSIQRFLKACLVDGQNMRPGKAWDLLEEFGNITTQLYGPSKYHHLDMP